VSSLADEHFDASDYAMGRRNSHARAAHDMDSPHGLRYGSFARKPLSHVNVTP